MLFISSLFLLCAASIKAFRPFSGNKFQLTALNNNRINADGLGGKVVVSGIGEKDEDEFMLTLLNEQVK
jgi:hypothetical protein